MQSFITATLGIVLVFGVALPPALRAAGQTALPDITVRESQIPKTVLKVCKTSDPQSDLVRWRPNLHAALDRLRSTTYLTAKAYETHFVERSECSALEDHSCFGKPGVVLCSEAVLARVLYAAAMTSGVNMLSYLERINRRTTQSTTENPWAELLADLDHSELGPIEALSLVDATEADREIRGTYAPGEKTKLEKRIEQLVQTYGSRARKLVEQAFTSAWGLQELDLDPKLHLKKMSAELSLFFESMHIIFRAAVDESLSLILGHELAHAHGGCLVAWPVTPEYERRFSEFVSLQISGRLLCQNPPSISELNADRCGLRVLHATDERLRREELLFVYNRRAHPGLLNIGRRHAIDLFGLLLAAKLGSSTQEVHAPYSSQLTLRGRPQYYPALVERKGYLYSALRLLLAADLLHARSQPRHPGVGVCGINGERLLEMLLRARTGCKEHAQTPLSQMTAELQKLDLPMAPGIATFFTTQHQPNLECTIPHKVPSRSK